MRMPRIAAKSEGGPYDGRSLVHYGTWHRVAYERDRPTRAVPGYVGEESAWLRIGAYVFHPTTECWHWFEDEAAAPISPEKYSVWITETPKPRDIARDVSRR